MLALEERAGELPHLIRFDDEAAVVSHDEFGVAITTSQGRLLSASLVIGADGRKSACREAAGITVSSRALDQSALTFNVAHARPHHNVSTEFHTAYGPCVFVPLPGKRSSVVWVSQPREAERLMALSDDELSAAAEKQSHSILGKMTVEPGRNLFPLAIERPKQFAAYRIALVGEAAHVVPPIGAQGLNMGLRDAADIAEIVREARERGEDIGSDAVLARFETRAAQRRHRAHLRHRHRQPLVAERSRCRCRPRALSACICSAASDCCGDWRCARVWRWRGDPGVAETAS